MVWGNPADSRVAAGDSPASSLAAKHGVQMPVAVEKRSGERTDKSE